MSEWNKSRRRAKIENFVFYSQSAVVLAGLGFRCMHSGAAIFFHAENELTFSTGYI